VERKFRIIVEDRQYVVSVEEITEEGHLTIPEPGSMRVPETPAPPPPAPASTAGAAPEAGPGDEVSPLAGVVQTVDVSNGQTVAVGDRLLSLEAMKMTTVVTAKRAGTVKDVRVKPGDAVDAGQPLLSIE
jgi:biotin carboxyl carrier protein